jgi:hypothetical protein
MNLSFFVMLVRSEAEADRQIGRCPMGGKGGNGIRMVED